MRIYCGVGIYAVCSLFAVGTGAGFFPGNFSAGSAVTILFAAGFVVICIFMLCLKTSIDHKKNRLKELEQKSYDIHWGEEEISEEGTSEENEVEMPLLKVCHG